MGTENFIFFSCLSINPIKVAEKKVTIRKRTGENIGPFTADEFIEMLQGNIDKKSLEN